MKEVISLRQDPSARKRKPTERLERRRWDLGANFFEELACAGFTRIFTSFDQTRGKLPQIPGLAFAPQSYGWANA